MPNMQTAPVEEVIEYLTVTLKKQYGDKKDKEKENNDERTN